MKTRNEYLYILTMHIPELKENFEVRSFRILGSVARNEQNEGSDVDVCVEMAPDMYLLIALSNFWKICWGVRLMLFECIGNMNSLLQKQIEKESINVF